MTNKQRIGILGLICIGAICLHAFSMPQSSPVSFTPGTAMPDTPEQAAAFRKMQAEFEKLQPDIDRRQAEVAKAEAERVARKAAEEVQFQRSARIAAKVKRSMKNPASFQLESAVLMKSGVLCLEFRATNSFNAIVPGHAVAVGNEIDIDYTPAWNKHCANRKGENVISIRHAMRIYE